jgi:hypothetical protein
MEANGGVLENFLEDECRYWVTTEAYAAGECGNPAMC